MTDSVVRRIVDGVAILTLNAPETRNAISVEMREHLLLFLREAAGDVAVRAVVITGANGNFSSGGQLQSNGAAPAPDAQRTRRNVGVLQDIVRLLSAGPKPTIAAVEGFAYGAGLSLAAACDVVVASDTARFCASFGKIGLMADAGLIWSLPQRVGPACAREILLSGRVVDAAEAEQLGLANAVVGAGCANDAAMARAAAFHAIAPLAIASMKRVLARGPNSLEDVLHAESDGQPILAMSEDYFEGRAAFKERRPPVFRGV